MITFSRFGKHGNLGNQLFQLASMIGISRKYGFALTLPEWEYSKFFKGPIPCQQLPAFVSRFEKVEEPQFHHNEQFIASLDNTKDYDILGWLQSEKYWKSYEELIRAKLEFANPIPKTKGIAISIRRGDYVYNPNYYLLPINYYLGALETHFPDWRNTDIHIYSDDTEYCRHHFGCFPNVTIHSGSAIDQLQSMASCENFIIANSTFSWWGAYLSGSKNVIRPAYNFDGKLLDANNQQDFWIKSWTQYDHNSHRIDLSDTTFVIPVSYDHQDREDNLLLAINHILASFKTNIIIGEQGGDKFAGMRKYCKYVSFLSDTFHRTNMINEMTKMAKTPYVINYDADVIISPCQILQAVHELRTKQHHFVFPYDGRFARVPRGTWYSKAASMLDTGILKGEEFRGTKKGDMLSVGGAIAYNKETFLACGGENENFISYGPEDRERVYRFEKLGYKVSRVPGVLYHMDHYIGTDSSTSNPYFKHNCLEEEKVKHMTEQQLRAYVKDWWWVKT